MTQITGHVSGQVSLWVGEGVKIVAHKGTLAILWNAVDNLSFVGSVTAGPGLVTTLSFVSTRHPPSPILLVNFVSFAEIKSLISTFLIESGTLIDCHFGRDSDGQEMVAGRRIASPTVQPYLSAPM